MRPMQPRAALYGGVWFRSRLEACWAFLFDELRIAWRYERDAFDLDGVRYLPDFYLPGIKTWFEAKGVMTDEDHTKVQRLAEYAATRGELVLVGGGPAGCVMCIMTEFGELNFEGAEWCHCRQCNVWSVSMIRCRACGYIDPGAANILGSVGVFDGVMREYPIVWTENGPARQQVPANWIQDGMEAIQRGRK